MREICLQVEDLRKDPPGGGRLTKLLNGKEECPSNPADPSQGVPPALAHGSARFTGT